MYRVGQVCEHDSPGRARILVLRIRPFPVCDAKVLGGAGRVAGGYARAVQSEWVAVLKILVRHLLEGGAGSKLNQDLGVAVPPEKARDVGVIPVEDPRLHERRRRG